MFSQRNNPYCDLLHFSTTKIRIKMIYPAIFSNAFFTFVEINFKLLL